MEKEERAGKQERKMEKGGSKPSRRTKEKREKPPRKRREEREKRESVSEHSESVSEKEAGEDTDRMNDDKGEPTDRDIEAINMRATFADRQDRADVKTPTRSVKAKGEKKARSGKPLEELKTDEELGASGRDSWRKRNERETIEEVKEERGKDGGQRQDPNTKTEISNYAHKTQAYDEIGARIQAAVKRTEYRNWRDPEKDEIQSPAILKRTENRDVANLDKDQAQKGRTQSEGERPYPERKGENYNYPSTTQLYGEIGARLQAAFKRTEYGNRRDPEKDEAQSPDILKRTKIRDVANLDKDQAQRPAALKGRTHSEGERPYPEHKGGNYQLSRNLVAEATPNWNDEGKAAEDKEEHARNGFSNGKEEEATSPRRSPAVQDSIDWEGDLQESFEIDLAKYDRLQDDWVPRLNLADKRTKDALLHRTSGSSGVSDAGSTMSVRAKVRRSKQQEGENLEDNEYEDRKTPRSADDPQEDKRGERPKKTEIPAFVPEELVTYLGKQPRFVAPLSEIKTRFPWHWKRALASLPHIFSLEDDGVMLRPEIKICAAHTTWGGCLERALCYEIHICPGFVMERCIDGYCEMGHRWFTNQNIKVMKDFHLHGLTSNQMNNLMKNKIKNMKI
ncbi:glutamic acid-rich protein-like [Penaeus japonicus]|uniref:glutamic acid-rich protein-like n=1 Tax=Penaeus japonicus TaxID=27405 RepID=UPI001C70E48F|nr:glutamic acid-rich protein-like [Penaeus japonicus]